MNFYASESLLGLMHQPCTYQACQRGQALTEFVLIMLVMLPLFLGVYYLGKYADIYQSAVQASRYAAFQRAMQPDEARLPASEIEDKLRARFFLRNEAFTQDGRLSASDSVKSLSFDKRSVSFWHDLSGNPLLKDPQQIRLAFQSEPIDSLATPMILAADWLYGQKNRPIQRANLEVSLFDHLNSGVVMKIGASTATLGDAWNAAGSEGVREAMTPAKTGHPIGRLVGGFTNALQAVSSVIGVFENHHPTFPCLSVETVPIDRTSGGERVQYGGCR